MDCPLFLSTVSDLEGQGVVPKSKHWRQVIHMQSRLGQPSKVHITTFCGGMGGGWGTTTLEKYEAEVDCSLSMRISIAGG